MERGVRGRSQRENVEEGGKKRKIARGKRKVRK